MATVMAIRRAAVDWRNKCRRPGPSFKPCALDNNRSPQWSGDACCPPPEEIKVIAQLDLPAPKLLERLAGLCESIGAAVAARLAKAETRPSRTGSKPPERDPRGPGCRRDAP